MSSISPGSKNKAITKSEPVAVATAPVSPVSPASGPVSAHAAAPKTVAVTSAATLPATAIAPRPVERDRTTVVALIAKLRDQDAEAARDAAATLGQLPADAEAVAALGQVLKNADGYFHSVVRAAAAASLGHLGDRNAVDALIAATRDTMAEASEEAVKALGALGDVRALPALETIRRNEKGYYLESVRRAAEQAAGRIDRR